MPQRILVNNGLVIGSGAAQGPRSIAALTDGQIPIGKTGYAPVPATPTGAGGIVVTGSAGGLTLTTRGYVETTTEVGNVGTGEDTLMSWTAPANTLIADSGLHVSASFYCTANANTKTIKFHVGGSSLTLNPTTTAPNDVFVLVDLWLTYITSTTARVYGTSVITPNVFELATSVPLTTTIDWTSTVVIKFTGEGTSTDDVRQVNAMMLAFRNPS